MAAQRSGEQFLGAGLLVDLHSGIQFPHCDDRTGQRSSSLYQPLKEFPTRFLLPNGLHQNIRIDQVGNGHLVAVILGLHTLEAGFRFLPHLSNPGV